MTQQFLTHFNDNLILLDSLVEESDKIIETTHIVFLQQAVKSITDLCQVHVMDTIWHQKTGLSGTLSYQSYYELLKSATYCHNITVNSAVNHCGAYTHLTHEDNDCAAGSIDFEPDNSEHDICTYHQSFKPLAYPYIEDISPQVHME